MSLSAIAQSPKTYSTSGTFTVPAGVTSVTAQAWGGGGKGGLRSGNSTNGTGGGGGGAFASSTVSVSALDTPYTVTVGLGSNTTAAGLDSWFLTTGTVLAKGGQSVSDNIVTGATGGLATGSVGTTKFNGGTGVTGTNSYSGGGGSAAGTAADGNTGVTTTGGIAPAGGGNGGNGFTSDANGNNGSIPGGGGGGAYKGNGGGSQTGGNGANGQVTISWTCATYSLTSTSITSPLCTTTGAIVNLTGGAGLPVGNYTVSYTLTGTNTGSSTATMSVTTAGSGTFTTTALSNAGLTNIQITNLSSGVSPDNCSNNISTNNTASITLASAPSQPSTITGSVSFCGFSSQAYSVTNIAGVTYNWTFPVGWTQTSGGTTNSIIVTTNGNSGNVSVTPSNSCGNGTVRTLAVTSTAPIVNAGSALASICQGGTTVALGGSFGGSATSAIWSDGGIGGTFTNNTGSTPNTTTWSPPIAYLGTATLTLTTSGGSCGTANTSKNQTVSTGPAPATVGSTMNITGSLTSTSLVGNTPSVGSGVWTLISGPPGTVTFSNSSSGTSTATVSVIGTYVFRWTISSSCGSSFAEITVNYFDALTNREYTLFYEDFDASNGGWTNTTSTNGSWLWTDSFPGVSEIGENSFLRTNSFNDYSNNAVLEITSPVYNFTGYENLLFNIDVRYQTQADTDGMRILYSINNGAFILLGANGSGLNWYNSVSVSALGGNGWSNNNATAALSFSPVGIGPNRFLRATTLLADATFKNQPNVRFKVEFRSDSSTIDNGVAFDNISVEGDAMVALVASPIAPASINQNLRLWFKSNAGISVSNGTALTAWEDQAYDVTRADLINKENVKALATDAPTYRDSAARNINFNPVVDFNSANKDYMNGKGGLYSQDYFVVVYSDNLVENTMGTTVRQIPLGGKSDEQSFHEDPTGLGLGNTTARYNIPEVIAHNVGAYAPGSGTPAAGVDSYGRSFASTSVTYNEPLIINVKTNANGTDTQIYKNGIKIDNQAGRTGDSGTGNLLNFYEYKNLPFYLGTGRSGISGRQFSALNGRLSEVVVYTSPNSALNQQKIQSYLGLKYGITLHNSSSSNVSGVSVTSRLNDVNYIDSAGNIFWNTTANTGYNYDIAGIGRDDDSQLYQKQSKSVNSTDDITIGLSDIAATNNLNTSTCNNRNFLVWGNNNGTLAAQPEVIINMSSGITSPSALVSNVSFISIGRTWKVVETGGNVPITKVSIPTAMLSATLTPPGDYLMFISSTTAFDPTAEYRVMTVNGSNLETSYDFDGTKYITFGFAPEKTFVRSIAFDGVNDYLDAGKVLNLNTSFTVSSWVKRNSTNKTILSKRNNTFTEGYDLSINSAGRAEMSWMNGSKQTITSSVVIPSGVWHNIAVTYNGTTAKLYIDGVLDVSNVMSIVPANTNSFLIAAADGVNTTSFFNGNIDEVRIWNVALTDKQLRYVMNQEILSNGLATNGSIIPNTISQNDISIIPWSNLSAYYPMSTYTYTNAKDVSINNYTAYLRNLTTVDRQTAPLPYESASNGLWQTPTTWLNNTVQYLPNGLSIIDGITPINWNIVRTNHNIESSGNKDLLGLFVDSNTLSATNDTKVEITHYLKLDGKIDLVNKSQLIQRTNSDLATSSSGSIERDQQGTKNLYNYNYWSSPVGPINAISNNNAYTVSGVMKDGTTTTPQNILWTTSLFASPTSPITLSSYWIFKFQNLTPAYANWQSVGISGALNPGQGYTLKGSGTAAATQNYTFVGKPNNASITGSIAANNLNLSGNPYASAIDATQFINDNNTSISGTIYFWEHAPNNATHVTSGYQGGYSGRNNVGGVPPSAPAGITGLGNSVKIPNRYIPVGQGFFIIGSATGGTITFNNNQREFIKEDNASSNGLFRVSSSSNAVSAVDNFNDNSETQIVEDSFKKIRLGYRSADNFYKQSLLGFMETNATNALDYGYDAINIDNQANDMYFISNGSNLIIQGVGYFDENAVFPLGIKNSTAGMVTFKLDEIQNFGTDFQAYIYDNVTNIYNNVRNIDFTINLPAGTINDRFSLRFINQNALNNADFNLSNGIQVVYTNANDILNVKNYMTDTTVELVTLYNMLGQQVGVWEVNDQSQQDIQVPIKNLSTGTYIVKVKTDKGDTSRKIIFN